MFAFVLASVLTPDALGAGGQPYTSRTGDGGVVVAEPYRGFAASMDVGDRFELSDEIVMRVRASEPALWRGQTFDAFDGRVWHSSEVGSRVLEAHDSGWLIGWVGFDPTVDVPLAPGSGTSVRERLAIAWPMVWPLVAVAAAGMLAWSGARGAVQWWHRRRCRFDPGHRLDRFGTQLGRPRAAHETVEYSVVLAGLSGRAEVVDVGRALSAAWFGRDPEAAAEASEILDRLQQRSR